MRAALVMQEAPARGGQHAAITHRPGLHAPRMILKLHASRRPPSWLRAGSLACECVVGRGGSSAPCPGNIRFIFQSMAPQVFSISFSVRVSWDPLVPQNVFLLPCCRLLLISMECFSYSAQYFSWLVGYLPP